jgi:glycosyltransferase involved in cell wall biosynthesis
MKYKLIRTATVSLSLDVLLKGQLAFLNQYFQVIAVSGADEHLERVRNREKVQVYDVKMVRKISPLQDLISLFKLYRLFKKEKPTIVHSITPKAGLLSMTAARMAGVPVRIHTFTGLLFPNRKGWMRILLQNTDRWLCRFATHIIPEGEGVKADLIQYQITSKPLNVIAHGNVNGVDLEYYNPSALNEQTLNRFKKNLHLENQRVFLFIGRLVGDKGINELIAAFQAIQEKHKAVKLLLVGNQEPELDPLTLQTIKAIKTNSGIISVGFHEDIRPYIALSDILVFPSYREGFPNVPLQCGSFKKALILSDINGCNEIVQHQKSGLLVPSKNTEKLVDAMETLLLNTDLRTEYGNKIYDHIATYFQQQQVWEALVAEYNVKIREKF